MRDSVVFEYDLQKSGFVKESSTTWQGKNCANSRSTGRFAIYGAIRKVTPASSSTALSQQGQKIIVLEAGKRVEELNIFDDYGKAFR